MATIKNSKNGYKGKKPYMGKQKGRQSYKQSSNSDTSDDRFAKPKGNSPDWYATNPALLRDAATLPYSWSLGTPVNLHNPALEEGHGQEFTIPGICAIRLAPAIGWSPDITAPINTASNSLYGFIRGANSGSSNYEAPDLMVYILAMSSLYSYVNYLQRIYGTVTLYSQKNRYIPDALLKAQYVNAENVRDNIANFRYAINIFIQKLASFAVPNNMSFFNRQSFIYQNVYSEGQSIKDQLYLYVPDSFWKFGLQNPTKAGSLSAISLRDEYPDLMTVEDLIEYGNSLLTPIISSESMNIMSGDIYKAYGPSGIQTLTMLDTNYTVEPVYNVEVLEQMKNAIAVTEIWGNSVLQYSQEEEYFNYLTSACSGKLTVKGTTSLDAAIRSGYQCLMEDKFLTTTAIDPTPEITMENSRLSTAGTRWQDQPGNASWIRELRTGSEVCTKVEYWKGHVDPEVGTVSYEAIVASYYLPCVIGNVTSMELALEIISMLNSFKFSPAVRLTLIAEQEEDVYAVVSASTIFDVDNYAVIPAFHLGKLHEAAIMNELNVPSIARV